MPLNPELAPYFKKMPRIDPGNRITRCLLAMLVRVAPMKRVERVALRKVRCGRVNARLHIPDNADGTTPRGALLWIHGGGYVLGHPRQDDLLCSEVAAALGIIVLAPQYRLAACSSAFSGHRHDTHGHRR
jgi:acetyl esterase/lipase